MDIKFKAEGKITDDAVELNLKIKGLSEFAKENVNLDEVLKSFFESIVPENNEKKQIQLPNGNGVMLIVSRK